MNGNFRPFQPRSNITQSHHRTAPERFTLSFAIALAVGLAAAVAIAPFAAAAVAAVGFRFPFPRIFDRVAMATLLAALLIASRRLRFAALVRTGCANPRANLGRFAIGFAIALGTLAILFALAAASLPHHQFRPAAVLLRAATHVPAALAIALIEEAFFRAFLLAGMRTEFGARGALPLSSAFYAIVHLIRSPAHYYLTGYHPAAGAHNLAASAAMLGHPAAAAPAILGLFLLGIALGEAFLLTGNIWMGVGMHAGFVLGAKSWGAFVNGAKPPRWIAGPGPVPLIAAPGAWIATLAICALLPRITRRARAQKP